MVFLYMAPTEQGTRLGRTAAARGRTLGRGLRRLLGDNAVLALVHDEEFHPVAAERLGGIKRHVRALQQQLRPQAWLPGRAADRHRDGQPRDGLAPRMSLDLLAHPLESNT